MVINNLIHIKTARNFVEQNKQFIEDYASFADTYLAFLVASKNGVKLAKKL